MTDFTFATGFCWRNTHDRYGAVAIALHWTIAMLFVAQYAIAYSVKLTVGYDSESGESVLAWHRSTGLLILLLVLGRLWWRAVNVVPPLPASVPPLQCILAHWTHWALYAVMLAQPLSGAAMHVARGQPVHFFGLAVVPAQMAADEDLAEGLFGPIHSDVMSVVTLVIVGMHVAAALKHHCVNRDNVLVRMLPRWAGGR